MNPIHRSPLLPLCAGLFAAAPAIAQYTQYGNDCGQPLRINNDSPFILGMTTRMEVFAAPPNQGALNILGLSQLAIPLLGCTLLVSPDAPSFFVTDSTGHAAHPLAMPVNNNFLGIQLNNQWLVLDPSAPQGIGFSHGGSDTIGNPSVGVGPFSPAGGPIGTVITATFTNLGTTNPDNICWRVVGQFGDTSLIRATSIVHDPSTGLDTVTGTLATAGPSPIGGGQMGVSRGTGAQVPVPAGVKLSAPADGWGWNGAATPQAHANGAGFFAFPNNSTPTQWTLSANKMVCNLPAGPFTTGQQISIDIHWDSSCPGQTPVHYDNFLSPMTVLANMTQAELKTELAQKLAVIYSNLYPGKVQVNVPVPVGPAVEVSMIDPNCTITSGGGSMYVQ